MSEHAPLTSSDATVTVSAIEPPIVARVMVEVRSDGTRTIARGALTLENEAVSFGAEGTSPAELASTLSRMVLTLLRERAALELLKWAPTLLGDARSKRLLHQAGITQTK